MRHCNNWANNKIGNHSFGATEDYFWGKSGGYVAPEDQEALDKSQKAQTYTINQPDSPSISTVQFRELQLRHREEEQFIKWFMLDDSTPQLYYNVKCTDVDGNVIYNRTKWAPEDFYHILKGVNTDAYLCELTVTDIFGQSTTIVNATEAYLEVHPDAPITNPVPDDEEDTDSDDNTDVVTPDDDMENNVSDDVVDTEKDETNGAVDTGKNETEKNGNNKTSGLVVGITVGAVAVVGAAVVGMALVGKRKKKKKKE